MSDINVEFKCDCGRLVTTTVHQPVIGRLSVTCKVCTAESAAARARTTYGNTSMYLCEGYMPASLRELGTLINDWLEAEKAWPLDE